MIPIYGGGDINEQLVPTILSDYPTILCDYPNITELGQTALSANEYTFV